MVQSPFFMVTSAFFGAGPTCGVRGIFSSLAQHCWFWGNPGGRMTWDLNWLVVSTHLKNISQLGWLFPIYGKIKNVPNHQPVLKPHQNCNSRTMKRMEANKNLSESEAPYVKARSLWPAWTSRCNWTCEDVCHPSAPWRGGDRLLDGQSNRRQFEMDKLPQTHKHI